MSSGAASASIALSAVPEAQSDQHNRRVAGYLAFIGGYVNSIGFLLLGQFTSHVTGTVSHFATELCAHHFVAAARALAVCLAFFGGATVASMIVESGFFGTTSRAYAVALSLEAALLALFAILFTDIPRVANMNPPPAGGVFVFCLSGAMGMQNSLVTRLSGAVVRTTHLTGVVTDLGIEAARWFRWWRRQVAEPLRLPLHFGKNPALRPLPAKGLLLATITTSFVLGAVIGSAAALRLGAFAVGVPILGLAGGAAYAVSGGFTRKHARRSAPDR